MPEAVTKWKFLGFAHDAELRGGLFLDEAVTARAIMVQPNPPRFLREGDELEFTVKVANQSAAKQTGTLRLSLANARTAESIDALLSLRAGGAGVSPATAAGTAAPQATIGRSIWPRTNQRATRGDCKCPTCPAMRSSTRRLDRPRDLSDGEEGLSAGPRDDERS